MATVDIAEFSTIPQSANGAVQAPPAETVANQSVTSITSTSKQSAAMNEKTRFVWLRADAAVNWIGGTNPTAASTHVPSLKADTDYFFGVEPGSKLAFRTV